MQDWASCEIGQVPVILISWLIIIMLRTPSDIIPAASRNNAIRAKVLSPKYFIVNLLYHNKVIAPKVKSKVTAGFNAYHNQSSIIFGSGKNNDWKKEEPIKPKKTVGSDKPVWNYDPKTAGKTTMILGNDKPDYRKKD